MTHYTVLVQIPKGTTGIGDYIAKVLAPYDENREVAPYVAMTKKKAFAEREKNIQHLEDILSEGDAERYDLGRCRALLKMSQKESPEEYWVRTKSVHEKFNKRGQPLSTYNPKSKWDWYSVGGRWPGLLRLKNGYPEDIAKKQDIDFDSMKADALEGAEKAWAHLEDLKKQAKRAPYWNDSGGLTKEMYLSVHSTFSTHAVVDLNGEWHEPSRMGWWATTHDETEKFECWVGKYRSRWIEPLDPEDILAVVDCHI